MIVETVDLPPDHVETVLGVLSTTIPRTVIDLMALLPPAEALAVVDSALRRDVPIADLRRLASELGLNYRSVEPIWALADKVAQSPLESMSRWMFHISHLPMPEPQVLIGDDAGPFALVDFLWREQGVVGESDGDLKYDADGEARQG